MASKQAIADLYGVPVTFIDSLIREGHLSAGKGRGGMREATVQIELARYALNAHEALKGANLQASPGGAIDAEEEDTFRAARIENIKADTRLKLIKEAELRGESAPVDVIRRVLSRVGREVYGIIQGVPGAIARRCPEVTPHTMELIKKELALAANACADVQLHDDDIGI